MHKLVLDAAHTGVAVPISALRTESSCGIGEFLDLIELGFWCTESRLSVIQILPVNDTGSLASPYSAVSAFALNPAYIRLDEVPETGAFADEIAQFRSDAESVTHLDYERVLNFKLDILHRAYMRTDSQESTRLDAWISGNRWVQTYAVYKCLKDRYEQRSWIDWPENHTPTSEDISQLWNELEPYARFYAWIQMHLDGQFRRVVEALHALGVYLKGDIPILMNVDSADVWAHREYFNLEYGAGAPPDVFTRTGQTWGFPIYRWDVIEADGYAWWNDRLKVASRYYDAFRIDHVIGFFRIWSQPAHERTAVLGHYEPSPTLSLQALEEAGLNADEIALLTEAWTTAQRAAEALESDASRVLSTYFVREKGAEYFLRSDLAGERLIESLDEDQKVVEFLVACHRDRSLVAAGPDAYYPAWYWDESSGVEELGKERTVWFNQLVNTYKQHSKPVWMDLGRRNLEAVSGATEMLACAEDLGAVPDGLAEVLESLQVLSLKIERWEVDDEGDYVDPVDFPHLSVSTPSVHDLATLRVWWEESDEHIAYFDALGLEMDCPDFLTVEVAEAIIRRNLRSSSAIVVFQIQDLFSLTYELRIDPPKTERINVPGTIGDHNWSYRIPTSIESLRSNALSETIRALIAEHRYSETTTEVR